MSYACYLLRKEVLSLAQHVLHMFMYVHVGVFMYECSCGCLHVCSRYVHVGGICLNVYASAVYVHVPSHGGHLSLSGLGAIVWRHAWASPHAHMPLVPRWGQSVGLSPLSRPCLWSCPCHGGANSMGWPLMPQWGILWTCRCRWLHRSARWACPRSHSLFVLRRSPWSDRAL